MQKVQDALDADPIICPCAKGDTGPQGIPGPDGYIGIPGTPGEPGTPGVIGDDGVGGDDGPSGTDGDQGPPGPQGADGDEGFQGDGGDDGESGAPGTDGIPGMPGPPGVVGPDGAKGPDGADPGGYAGGDTCPESCIDHGSFPINCAKLTDALAGCVSWANQNFCVSAAKGGFGNQADEDVMQASCQFSCCEKGQLFKSSL